MTLREKGWEYLRRLSERPSAPPVEMTPEDDEWLVEPPDPAIWRDLPVTRWGSFEPTDHDTREGR